jgi:hypothetical protein
MKALLVSAAAIGLLSAAPAFAQAGPTSTASAGADAVIVTPISVINVEGENLDFGTIAADTAAGTVTVDGAGGLTSSSPNLIVTGSTGNAAAFDVSGQANLAYTATIDPSVTLSGPGTDMSATLTKYGGAAALDGTGSDSFTVGGTLSVGANQAAGSYTGSFDVSVAYD